MRPRHEYEQAIIQCLLVAPDKSATQVFSRLKTEHIDHYLYRSIFEACESLYSIGTAIDQLTVWGWLQKMGNTLDAQGGIVAISKLATELVSTANLDVYISHVEEANAKRQLFDIGNALAKDVKDPSKEPISLAHEYQTKLSELEIQAEGGFKHIESVLEETLPGLEEIHLSDGNKTLGLPTGIKDLDSMTGGLCAPDLILIAARPSMGKSAFAFQQMAAVARAGHGVGLFTLEMSREQVAQRLICIEGRMSLFDLRNGLLSDQEFKDATATMGRISRWPIYIDDTAGLHIADARARARRMCQEKQISLLVVDYLQLMTGDSTDIYAATSQISKGLKAMAKENNVPVIALSQLNRAVEERRSKVPQLSDLRDSGTLEQDADNVYMLFRPGYYKEKELSENSTFANSDEITNEAVVKIEKQRNGPTGIVSVFWEATSCQYYGLDSAHSEQNYEPPHYNPGQED